MTYTGYGAGAGCGVVGDSYNVQGYGAVGDYYKGYGADGDNFF